MCSVGVCSPRKPSQAKSSARPSEILFGLLRHIGECHEDVVFFADEGGFWCFGVNWRAALAAYFKCLAQTTSAMEFARSVDRVIADFAWHDRGWLLGEASRAASSVQQASLSQPATDRDDGAAPGQTREV
jgi:hypothetical protein